MLVQRHNLLMAKKDLLALRIDHHELALIREGLDLVTKDREFTIKVQPASAASAVAATDALRVIAALQLQLAELG